MAVSMSQPVLAASEYWNPPPHERSEWLVERVLPAVRRYLGQHHDHGIIYTHEAAVCDEDSLYYNWWEVES